MTSISIPNINVLNSFSLKETQISYQGKTYRIETSIKKQSSLWRIQQFIFTLFLSISTLEIGLIFPTIRTTLKLKWIQVIKGGIISCQFTEIPHSISEFEKTKKIAQTALHQIYEHYSSLYYQEKPLSHGLSLLKFEFEKLDMSFSNIYVDQGLANLLLPFNEQSTAFFVPHSHYLGSFSDIEASKTMTESGWIFLQNTLSNAFISGKEFVVSRLNNFDHCAVAAFRSDGQFRIIDSLLDNTINLEWFTKKLNDAQIKNSFDQVIQFKGRIINTHLQKSGCECARFATLYGYQMLKKQSFDGFKEVNGAFAEGRLCYFEDISKIDGAPLLEDASQVPSENYTRFMNSWAYRTQGIEVDDWKNLTLDNLAHSCDINNEQKVYEIYILNSKNFIQSDVLYPTEELELRSPIPKLTPLNPNWKQIKLESLIPKEREKTVLIFEKYKDPQIFYLPYNLKVLLFYSPTNNKYQINL